MGLDTVELVMELEDAFSLAMPDEDAEKIQTIGDTVSYIVGRLRLMSPAPLGHCHTSRAFYRLRREMHRQLGVPRRQIMPRSRIGELVRSNAARSRWNNVAAACNLEGEPRGLFLPGFPRPEMTVRQLIYARGFTDRVGPQLYYLPNGEVNTRAVWTRVQSIVSEQLGVNRDELKWDTHYIRDLNCD